MADLFNKCIRKEIMRPSIHPPNSYADALTFSVADLEMGPLRKNLELNGAIPVGSCSGRITILTGRDTGADSLSLPCAHRGKAL